MGRKRCHSVWIGTSDTMPFADNASVFLLRIINEIIRDYIEWNICIVFASISFWRLGRSIGAALCRVEDQREWKTKGRLPLCSLSLARSPTTAAKASSLTFLVAASPSLPPSSILHLPPCLATVGPPCSLAPP